MALKAPTRVKNFSQFGDLDEASVGMNDGSWDGQKLAGSPEMFSEACVTSTFHYQEHEDTFSL